MAKLNKKPSVILKVILLPLLLITLVGAGCQKSQTAENNNLLNSSDSQQVVENEETNNLSNKPPAITITESGIVHNGVAGSYCYQGVCADTVGPVELISGKNFETINNSVITVNLGESATSLDVQMLTKDGKNLCTMTTTAKSDKEYQANLCTTEPGNYIILAGEQIAGGDIIYFFPVTLSGCDVGSLCLQKSKNEGGIFGVAEMTAHYIGEKTFDVMGEKETCPIMAIDSVNDPSILEEINTELEGQTIFAISSDEVVRFRDTTKEAPASLIVYISERIGRGTGTCYKRVHIVN